MKKKCVIGVLFSSYAVNYVAFSLVLHPLLSVGAARVAGGGAGGVDRPAARSTTPPGHLLAAVSQPMAAIALNLLLLNFLLNFCLILSHVVLSFLGLHAELQELAVLLSPPLDDLGGLGPDVLLDLAAPRPSSGHGPIPVHDQGLELLLQVLKLVAPPAQITGPILVVLTDVRHHVDPLGRGVVAAQQADVDAVELGQPVVVEHAPVLIVTFSIFVLDEGSTNSALTDVTSAHDGQGNFSARKFRLLRTHAGRQNFVQLLL